MVAAHRTLPDAAAPDRAVAPAASDLIARVDGVMGGRPVIRGTRITVDAVKGRVSGGESLDDLLADYPGVAREAFEAALAHADRVPAGSPGRDGDRSAV